MNDLDSLDFLHVDRFAHGGRTGLLLDKSVLPLPWDRISGGAYVLAGGWVFGDQRVVLASSFTLVLFLLVFFPVPLVAFVGRWTGHLASASIDLPVLAQRSPLVLDVLPSHYFLLKEVVLV